MEAVAIALVVFGPLVAIMLLLVKATRKLMPRPVELPAQRFKPEDPPRGGDLAGDREPRRPLIPSRSGAVALTVPTDDDDDPGQEPVRRMIPPASADDADGRLAG